jgi:hypothetical protein
MRISRFLAISVVYALVMFASAEAARLDSPDASRARRAVLPKTAELVPAETIVLVDINDFNRVMARFEKNSIYKLYKEPAMLSFVANFTGGLREKVRGDNNLVIETILDANALPEGRVAIATDSLDWRKPPIVVISQWGRNIDRIKEAIEKATSEAVVQGANKAIVDYCDVNLVTLTTGTARQTTYCFIDDCLIAGTDVNTVKFAIGRIKGAGTPGLAADLDYAAVMSAVGPYHDVDLYVNAKQLIKKFVAEDATGKVQTTLSNLGFDNVAGLGCSLGFGADGLLCGKAFLKTSGFRKGVLKMLETSLESIRPPRFVPASAYSVSFLNVDIRRAYDEWCSIDPAAAMSLQKPLVEPGANGEPAIVLRQDIIEYLGSQIVIAQSINKPFTAGAMPTETIVAVSVSNRSALEKSLSRWMEPNNPESTRELLGHTIYLLGPSGVPFFGGAAPAAATLSSVEDRKGDAGARMAFAITDTHLIFGQEPAIERAIRTLDGAASEPLGSTEWFTAAKSVVPSVVGLAGFEDNSASGELLWWMLKENAKARRADIGMGPPAAVLRLQDAGAAVLARPDLWQFADFSLLPEFDAVRKYFGYSAFYGASRADGFLFEFKYLTNHQSPR